VVGLLLSRKAAATAPRIGCSTYFLQVFETLA
jgi:hypothetical protein